MLERLVIGFRVVKLAIGMARAVRPDSPYSTADLIEKQVASRGDHPFCRYQDRVTSYTEYNAAANRIAHWGLEVGLKRGDVVALLMLNRPEYLETWAGLAKIGVTAALINTNLSGRALAHALNAAGTNRLIVGSECLEALRSMEDAPEGLQVIVAREQGEAGEGVELAAGATDLGQAVADLPIANPDRSVRAGLTASDDLFYIYTSGTTGLPKAARLSHARFVGAGAFAAILGFGKSDTMYNALPLYHSAGGAGAVGATLSAGGTLALRRKFSASQFWDDVRRYEAAAFPYIGEFCRYLLNVPPSDLDGQHKIRFVYGNGLRPDIWEEFRDRFKIPRIIEFYGATEGNVGTINLDGKVGSVGKLPSRLLLDARLVRYDVVTDEYERDANGFCIECKPGEAGELIGALPKRPGGRKGRFEGYTSQEATEKKVLRNA
ncbi:MAG: AMP-binding protein, partial [Myxococcota bacterium]